MSERCFGAPASRFSLPGSTPHYAADRPAIVEHVQLEVELSFERRAISGLCVTTVKTVRPIAELTFDAVALSVESVEVGGRSVAFFNSGKQLTVEFPALVTEGETLSVAIRYRAQPNRGIYFIAPDTHYPTRPLQAWTQGQDEDARAWFPCLDAPAQKATTEVAATFPAAMVALSNGQQVEDTVRGDKRTVRYRLDSPHAAYLMTLVVGDFEIETEEVHGVTFRTYLPPGRKEDALRCTRRTPEMLAEFQRLTGQPYAFGSYAQAFVAEFIFGGMENTSATTLTDSVLHDERAALDYSAEYLIAHELAHQWFGDLLTCRDWPHGWLNEGFATYFEVLWKEHADGVDEADQARREELEQYLSEGYSRPIVERTFHEPIELFDRHLYQKGGLFLHLLRHELSDALFFKALRHYVQKHRFGAVETVDLQRAIEESTGRNLDAFFDAYVFRAGHPSLKVGVRYETTERRLRIEVKQEGKDEAAFPLTLTVHVLAGGPAIEHRLRVTEKAHVFFLACAAAPTQVVIDPHRALLATLEVDKSLELWKEELRHAPEARARTSAAIALGKEGSRVAVEALGDALRSDPFWGTQAACARSLSRIRSPGAEEMLLRGLSVSHPKARRAVVSALGDFRGSEEVALALRRRLAAGDASYFVEGELARSLGRLRFAEDVALLQEVLKRPSFVDTIAVGAIDGLAASGLSEALPILMGYLRYGEPSYRRRAAASGVVRLADLLGKKAEVADALVPLLRDPQFRVQIAALDAVERLGERKLAGVLDDIPFEDGRLRRMSKEAARTLREGEGSSANLTSLRDELEKLKGETRALKEKVEALKPPKEGKVTERKTQGGKQTGQARASKKKPMTSAKKSSPKKRK